MSSSIGMIGVRTSAFAEKLRKVAEETVVETSLLEELAERCETAAGPDRGLDRLLIPTRLRGTPAPFWIENECGDAVPAPFTASIGSALTLVPEGYGQMITATVGIGSVVWLIRGLEQHGGNASTTALAICAAALRARGAS